MPSQQDLGNGIYALDVIQRDASGDVVSGGGAGSDAIGAVDDAIVSDPNDDGTLVSLSKGQLERLLLLAADATLTGGTAIVQITNGSISAGVVAADPASNANGVVVRPQPGGTVQNVGGKEADGATLVQNPVPVGGKTGGGLIKAFAIDTSGNLGVVPPALTPSVDQVSVGVKTTGGATPSKLVSAASTNATVVKASAGTVYGIQLSCVNAAARYLKLYNKATTPTVGTDTPIKTVIIPGNTAGAGNNVPIPAQGIAFSNGISFALTTEATDAGTTGVAASEIVVNIDYT